MCSGPRIGASTPRLTRFLLGAGRRNCVVLDLHDCQQLVCGQLRRVHRPLSTGLLGGEPGFVRVPACHLPRDTWRAPATPWLD